MHATSTTSTLLLFYTLSAISNPYTFTSLFIYLYIANEHTKTTTKPKKTHFQGKQRQTMLEQAVSQAQHSESRVTNFQNWVQRTDEALNEHLENDTTMDDLPHDFQVASLYGL